MLTMEVSNNENIVVERGLVHAVALLIIQYHSEDLECVWFLLRKKNIFTMPWIVYCCLWDVLREN